MLAQIRPSALTDYLHANDLRAIRWQLYLGLAAFAWGIIAGLAQALERVLPATSTIWRLFPGQKNYYQGLTAHGVLMVLVFTFAFINAFQILVTAHSLKRRPNPLLLWGALLLMTVGALMAGVEIMANRASVLFTMYPPLAATPAYYLGLVLVVVSTWLMVLNILLMYRGWRKEHPGEKTPLQAFVVLCNAILWFVASIGVAVEVLVLLLPWSMGIVPKTDAELARSLFWFTGHAIVYVWLLPAYVSWYTMVPKQAGGKIFSDGLVRLVFVLFLILSVPTGFHHQYTDPGIPVSMKTLHLFLTFGIFFPSLITAFTLMAAFENAGRSRGGKGLFGWIRKLPWGDPSVSAQILAMFAFVLGGISGLVNASYSMNLMVHNSAWVPGHFHLTVGTAVALSFLAICYWLVPHLTGRALWGRKLAVAQGWLWFVGVLLMSRGLVVTGLGGEPRRLAVALMPPVLKERITDAAIGHAMTGFGGTLMFISGLLFFLVIAGTLLNRQAAEVEMPVVETMIPASQGPRLFDRWPVLIGVMLLVIAIAYGPFFLTYEPNFVSQVWKVWGGPP